MPRHPARATVPLRTDSRGATLTEYILLLGVLAIAAIAAFSRFGGALTSKTGSQRATLFGGDGAGGGALAANDPGAGAAGAGGSQCSRDGTCGTGGCFVAGTLVATDRGSVPIEQVTVGTFVAAAAGEGEGEGSGASRGGAAPWPLPVASMEAAVTLDLSQGRGEHVETLLLPGGVPVQTAGRGPLPVSALASGERVALQGGAAGLVTARVAYRGPLSRAGALQRVIGVTRHRTSRLLVLRTTSDTLTTTEDHPFSVPGKGWVPAGKLASGDRVEAETKDGTATVLSAQPASSAPAVVYNLLVEGPHTYRVGQGKLLVHNGNCFSGPAAPAASPSPQGITPNSGPGHAATPMPGAPQGSTFGGTSTITGASPATLTGARSDSGPRTITEENGVVQVNMPSAGSPANGQYLHWSENGRESVTLQPGDSQFATAPLTGCAIRIQTNDDGTVTVTHYNAQPPENADPANRYNGLYTGLVNEDAGNPKVQWIVPGRDYYTNDSAQYGALLTGSRGPSGAWDWSLQPTPSR